MFSEALWTNIHDQLPTVIQPELFSQKDIIDGVVIYNNKLDVMVNNIIILNNSLHTQT